MFPKWNQNGPKMDPKRSPNEAEMDPGGAPGTPRELSLTSRGCPEGAKGVPEKSCSGTLLKVSLDAAKIRSLF